jgi:hypothetical protein
VSAQCCAIQKFIIQRFRIQRWPPKADSEFIIPDSKIARRRTDSGFIIPDSKIAASPFPEELYFRAHLSIPSCLQIAEIVPAFKSFWPHQEWLCSTFISK